LKSKIPIIGKPKDKKEQLKTIELKSEPIKEEAQKISLDKILKENVQMGQYKLNYVNDKGEMIIFKDELFYDYVEKVYYLLLLWSIGKQSNVKFSQIDFKKAIIESPIALEFLLIMALDISYFLETFDIFNKIFFDFFLRFFNFFSHLFCFWICFWTFT